MRELWEKNKKNFWCLFLITGVASLPLLTDYVLYGSSLAATLSQIKVVSQGIGKVFPVRIGTMGAMDYGYSAVAFQANVCYLIPALLHLLGMSLGGAYKWSLFLCNGVTAVVSYRCFRKGTGRQELGLFGSMLYTWNPYRLSELYLVGDLGEIAAWSFLPMVLLGLWLLYTQDREEKEYGRLWVLLTWGFSLITVSSTVILFAVGVMAVLTFLVMGRESLRKKTLLVIGKTVTATVFVNAWFLIPMMLRMRDASAVGPMIRQDIRSFGMFLMQYLTVFSWGSDQTALWENGMQKAQAMGPGIAVILLLFLYLWVIFVKEGFRQEKSGRLRTVGRLSAAAGIMVFFSTSLFPWDLFQDRNLLFSILLALMDTPAKLGIGAGAGLIAAACFFLGALAEDMEERTYKILLFLVTGISFGTTQFLLGKILTTRNFVRQEGIEALSAVPFPLILQESVVWRLSEVISIAALCGCVWLWIMRRRKTC